LDEIWDIVSQMLGAGLALADFGRDPHSSDSLRGSRNFVFLCRFPVGQILRHFNTTMSIGEAMKTFGTEF